MKPYEHFGVMLDVSRNAVLKPETLKEYMGYLAKMGYDTVELYSEDVYEVEEEPYLGYLRGRYTKEELKDVVAHAATLGIEVIPCIQTLAHFSNSKRIPAYAGMWDTDDILLVGEERTYEFIERIFKSVAECFTSRHINIGMDEAYLLGQGKYLEKHGYTKRSEILLSHLARVCKIAEKYGFKPHMWSDMFFRLIAADAYFSKEPVHVPKEVRDLVPENISLAYWDYYHYEKERYDHMLDAHLEFNREVWFAGGAWSWTGFIPQNEHTLRVSLPAMRSVREHGIKNVFLTMWGDDGAECSFFTLLPSLYAARQYALGNEDETAIKAGFEKLFGISYDAMMLLDLPNATPSHPAYFESAAAKPLFYQDPFMGIYDKTVEKLGNIPYNDYADRLSAYADNPDFGYLFAFEAALCRTLAKKYDLGVRTRAAYLAKDSAALQKIADEYPALIASVENTYDAFSAVWYRERKPFGFEIQDVRFGGLIQRLKACEKRLGAYLNGRIERIEELEQTMLPWYDRDTIGPESNYYVGTVSTSHMAP